MTTDIEDMQTQFKKVLLEHKRLNNLKSRYIEYGQKVEDLILKIDDIKKGLMDLQKDIDPGILLKRQMGGKKIHTKTTPYVEEIHGRIMAGQQVTMRYLTQVYPDLSPNNITYIFRLLKKSANVDHTKDGQTSRLFKRKDYH